MELTKQELETEILDLDFKITKLSIEIKRNESLRNDLITLNLLLCMQKYANALYRKYNSIVELENLKTQLSIYQRTQNENHLSYN